MILFIHEGADIIDENMKGGNRQDPERFHAVRGVLETAEINIFVLVCTEWTFRYLDEK